MLVIMCGLLFVDCLVLAFGLCEVVVVVRCPWCVACWRVCCLLFRACCLLLCWCCLRLVGCCFLFRVCCLVIVVCFFVFLVRRVRCFV